MSNLLKSKFLLGVMVVATLLVGVVAVNATSASAACSITTTLRVGSKGEQVKCLQTAVGVSADGSFGPKTKAAVIAWQKSMGLVADGVFGAKSRAAFAGGSMGMTYPAGCTSASGFSSTTGMPCTSTSTTLPAGCTSTAGFSPVTGASCATGAMSQTGPVQAMLASDNPASGYIVANQATADLLHVAFTGTGVVNSVTLQRTGVSDQNTLSNVYLFDGMTRLTDGYSFNNSGQLTMNGLNIVVSGSKVISVKADVASVTNASSLGMTLVGFTAAGNSASTVNIRGNEMTYGVGNLASVYLSNANQTVTGTPTVNAGTSAYTVWSSPLQVNTRAVWLKGANFRIVGSAPADALQNIKLYVDGVSVGSAATMGSITGSNYAMFDFSATPVSLSTGSHTVDVRADVVKGASYTVQVSLQQASDLVLYDGQVGVNIAVTKSNTLSYVASTAETITINAGSASVVVDPTFQAMTNITGGATNVAIAKYKVHGYGEDVKVSSLSVTPVLINACTSGTVYGSSPCNVTTAGATHTQFATGNGLNNVTVFFNGSQVGSSQNWGSGTLSFNLGSQMILPAGADSYIEVRADLTTSPSATGAADSTATAGVNYTAGTVSANLTTVVGNGQGQTSHSTLDFPSTTKTGNTLTIQTGTLAVSKNTGYASQNVTPNTAGVKIGSYILQNQSTSESVRVTSLAVRLTRNDGSNLLTSSSAASYPALTNFSNLRTSETSGSGANPIQPAGSNTFSVDFTIAPSATKVIDIFADTSSEVTNNIFSTNMIVTSIGSSSNVAVSQNGNGTAVAGQILTITAGTIANNVTLLTAPSTAQQFVPAANGGATNATKATFKINATGGTATISELKFTVNDQDFSAATTTAATSTGSTVITPTTAAESDRFKVGDSVQLVCATTNGIGVVTAISAGTNVTVNITVACTGATTAMRLVPATVTGITVNGVTAAPVNGVAYLTGLNLVVPNGGSGLSQDVFVSYAEVGTNGIATGSTSRIALEYIKYASGNTTTTLSTTTLGGSGLTGVTAPTMKLVGSAPSSTLSASTQLLSTGSVNVGNVVVTANAKGDITLNTLPINVILTSATMPNANPGYAANGIVVKDKDGNPVTTTNTAFSGTTAGGTSTITFTNGYQIPAGTSQTFKIFLTFDAVTAANHAGQASLSLGTADLFSWTDTAGNASATTGLDVAGSAATTLSNRYKNGSGATAPGFFYNYPTTTVGVSS